MARKYNREDEIELKLTRSVGYWYDLCWRVKPKVHTLKLLSFNIKIKGWGRWHYIMRYDNCGVSLSSHGNPNDSSRWSTRSIDMGTRSGQQNWLSLKAKMKTYGQLNDYFNMELQYERYKEDVEEYKQLKKDTKKILKEIL